MQLDLPSIVVSSHSDDPGSNSRNDRASPALLNPLMPLMMTQMAFSQRKCPAWVTVGHDSDIGTLFLSVCLKVRMSGHARNRTVAEAS
ncbi:hypothetical protein GCK72_011107 [Caenorhabditis remanei]|uniref:Uncharacterized protein n=1 Tax=Caenorhabditis remanei TaxID=31234 RepID=A0A6A5H7S0_CAERE|nr:hypothetical protein GCK72_011107 [Caenorhabditis remanei]KAF1762844.1 hypothetical protein GCK72_011107 [Caenorhabditis remanei]